MEEKKELVAKIENEFVLKAHYSLSATEQKLILYLASIINPQENEQFHKQVVPIKNLERLFSGEDTKRWGSVYAYLENVCDRLLTQTIRFTKPVILNNQERIIKGGINWFQHILIVENRQKEKSIEFMFSDMMKPFLLELNKYVKLNALEIMDLRGKYAVRMYQVFKAERERTRKHKSESILSFELDELKNFLGISGKYDTLPNLRRRVLEPMVDEINKFSKEIQVDFEYLKKRAKVVGIQFLIKDAFISHLNGPESEDLSLVDVDIGRLTKSRYMAFKMLLDFGVLDGIAYHRILPTIGAGEVEGYEDVFIRHAINHFNKKTDKESPEAKAGAFVKWWTEKKAFSTEAELYWQIQEKVQRYKKSMSEETRHNRELAKTMSHQDFLNRQSQRG